MCGGPIFHTRYGVRLHHRFGKVWGFFACVSHSFSHAVLLFAIDTSLTLIGSTTASFSPLSFVILFKTAIVFFLLLFSLEADDSRWTPPLNRAFCSRDTHQLRLRCSFSNRYFQPFTNEKKRATTSASFWIMRFTMWTLHNILELCNGIRRTLLHRFFDWNCLAILEGFPRLCGSSNLCGFYLRKSMLLIWSYSYLQGTIQYRRGRIIIFSNNNNVLLCVVEMFISPSTTIDTSNKNENAQIPIRC